MADTKRCPHCGGLNPANADWCGQCLERFTPKPAPTAVAPAPPPMADPLGQDALVAEAGLAPGSDAATQPRSLGAPPTAAVGTRRGAFAVREHGVVWTCPRCDNENSLDDQLCSVCGTTFAEVVTPKQERPQRDPGTAALVSLFFPGAGHGYLGLWGQAIARGVLHAWVLFVVLIAVLQKGAGSVGIVIVFGIAATGLWGVSAHDAYREARHEERQVLLKGKVFLYSVLGLLVLLVAILMTSGLRARA